MGDFSERVFAVVRQVPHGKVASYGQVARLIGAPRSARYVGYALHANPDPDAEVNHIPCHRIVFKDGGLCRGYAFGGPDVQREMLEEEEGPSEAFVEAVKKNVVDWLLNHIQVWDKQIAEFIRG